jgi:uncharacterized protein
MTLGLISDTHNYLDPRIAALFAGVEHILHAGDIGQPRLLWELERIAPVTAVGGNTDDPGFRYPLHQVFECDGCKFLLQHIVNPHSPGETLESRLAREKPQAIVFGHSHRPFSESIGNVRYINPGYSGKARFGLERSVAIVHVGHGRLRTEFLRLD